MFEEITQTTKTNQAEIATTAKQAVRQTNDQDRVEKPKGHDRKEQDKLQEPEEKESQQKVSQEFLNELEKDIELIHHIGLQFSVHESTGRTVVKVVNKDTQKVIREVPPEKILDLAAKLEEMIGILFNERV
ncbi:MAG: flagellar protein FlaG [Deltaproteobacteria bacterium]|nr:flagellar protein FlaG [Deltaproteobacteria bacterium]MBW1995831.1 flagellar protein FlaG [Deltaproteobacteria bacterium]